MHISSHEERMWLQEKIENQTYTLRSQDKKEILRHLIESEMFEQFLHMKFPEPGSVKESQQIPDNDMVKQTTNEGVKENRKTHGLIELKKKTAAELLDLAEERKISTNGKGNGRMLKHSA